MSNAFLYIVTVLVWGSTWFAIEFQLGEVAPEVSLVYRYLGAAACLFGWCWWRGRRLRFSLKSHVWFALLGALLFGINYVFAYRAQIYISSALTAMATHCASAESCTRPITSSTPAASSPSVVNTSAWRTTKRYCAKSAA